VLTFDVKRDSSSSSNAAPSVKVAGVDTGVAYGTTVSNNWVSFSQIFTCAATTKIDLKVKITGNNQGTYYFDSFHSFPLFDWI
jgi:hypothetical protein